jgi:hypothetical protein
MSVDIVFGVVLLSFVGWALFLNMSVLVLSISQLNVGCLKLSSFSGVSSLKWRLLGQSKVSTSLIVLVLSKSCT